MNLSQWMKELDGDRKILEFNLPGAHDCATAFIQQSKISRCQQLTIGEMLRSGVRVLDVRVAPKGKRLAVVHSKSRAFVSAEKKQKMDFSDIVDQCELFLKTNPSETIILQFKNDAHDLFDKKSSDLLSEYVEKKRDLWFTENRVPALNEVRGKIVLLRRCFIRDERSKDNLGLDLSGWIDQDKAVPEPMTLSTGSIDGAEILIHDRYKYKPRDRWEQCLEAFLKERKAFDGTYIICFTSTAGGIKGPEFNAKFINNKLTDSCFDRDKYYGIVYFDFVGKEFAEKVASLNF